MVDGPEIEAISWLIQLLTLKYSIPSDSIPFIFQILKSSLIKLLTFDLLVVLCKFSQNTYFFNSTAR